MVFGSSKCTILIERVVVAQEKQLEFSVLGILEEANATDYTSLFARHRITIETLLQLSEDDIKQVCADVTHLMSAAVL